MYTSLVVVALLGPGSTPLAWQPTYAEARQVGRQQGKPVAVFVGAGKDGWGKLSRDDRLSAPARQTLAEKYVCVYADTTTAAGRRLADAFGMRNGSGLVLSTRDGEEQAFRHDGRMSGEDLERTLRRFSNGAVSSRTETLQGTRVSGYYAPANGTAAPQQYVVPAAYTGGFGGFRGGAGC